MPPPLAKMAHMSARDSATSAVEQVRDVAQRARETRVVRFVQRYTRSNGPLLGAGMAYQSVFALFAAIWVGFSVAGIWIRSNNELYNQLISIVNHAVPGLIGDEGVITPQTLARAGVTLSITGIIALVGLIWTALTWLSWTRRAIRTLFGVGRDQRGFIVQRSVDAVQALAFGVGLIASSLIAVLTRQFLTGILDYAGLDSHSTASRFWLGTLSIVVTLLINFGTLAGMYRVLSRLYIPWRSLLLGAALGAVALSALSQASGLLLGGATRNALLAPFAIFVGLLLWFNLVCQVILLGAAWIAVGMEDRGISARRLTAEEQEQERRRAAFAQQLEAARDAVRAASARYEASGGWLEKRRNRRALLHALRVLQNVSAGDPDQLH